MSRRPPGRAEISALLAEHGISPSRALGQNFVTDPNLVERVARLAGVGVGDRVVEIGAGLGSLTIALAATGAEVLAVEIDRHLEPVLRELVEPLGVTVVRADAMSCDWAELLGAGAGAGADRRAWVLVANLPYNIATPLVLDVLMGVPSVARLLVMVQREVGERLAAQPGSRAYGAVSVRLAYFADARVVARVPADVFVPRPNVESVLVEIVRRPAPAVPADVAGFEEIDVLVRAGFSGRRKMLRRSLAGLVTAEAFAAAGVAPTSRPEELGVEAWGKLAQCKRLTESGQPVPPP
ncbi:MAG TPA: 16S rRNA (adenine(1518)-N(6)/adenine(1519)-N(6))-dimethyltransferase RsmA [Acidimicrobiales bacterium]|nr:16S rRNA (adenine(1518)-N(6)/adenine(1519)-N(6))-dimethyltransferase RsmA [Acidimicrobiales bacterium]